jgi:hypothetical protein
LCPFLSKDFSDTRDFAMSQEPVIVSNFGDLHKIPIDFNASDFEDVFYAAFPDTDASIFSIVCLVFLIRKYLPDFENQRTAPKGQVQTLF